MSNGVASRRLVTLATLTPLILLESCFSHPLPQTIGGGDYRRDTCKSLARIGAASVEPLIRALKCNTVDVRLEVVSALSKIGDKRAMKPLCELLLNDKESRVRAFAASTLGELKDQSAVTPLIGALKDSDSRSDER